jgi:hypothetical protein
METWLFPATEDRRSVISCARAGKCRRTCCQAGRGYLSEEAAALHARRTKPFFAHCGIHDALATDIAKPSLAQVLPCDSPFPVGKLNAVGLSNQL